MLLVALGFVLVFSPEILVDNVHWGVAPTWSNLAIAMPVAMLAYTGVETVSNLAEEVRDPVRNVPSAYKLVAFAVFAIYFTLPLIALSALPVELIDGELTTLLALPPEEGGYANDPILGVVQNLGVEGGVLDALEIYVGVLAATILFIATNAGVIGASRITYSMATYRQIPEVFRRLHPRFKTPWLSLVLFAGIAADRWCILPGDVKFVGTLYSFGATLSFTVAHASLVRLRMRAGPGGAALPRAAEPPLRRRSTGRSSRSSAGIATGISFLVIVVQNPATRWVGLGWLVGRARVLRRSTAAASCTRRLPATVKAPPAFGPALALEYRRLLVPVVPGRGVGRGARRRREPRRRARRADRGGDVLEVPLDLPLSAELPEQEALANRELDEARAIGESYGVSVIPRLVRGRSAGAAIVGRPSGAAPRSSSSARRARTVGRGKRAVFGRTVDYVLKHAPCRVMVAAIDGRRREALPRRRGRARAALRRDRRRAARRHGGRGRRRARLPARRALHRARRRAADAAPRGGR